MCTVCGCSEPGHIHDPGPAHRHGPADLDFGANAARLTVPGLGTERAIQLEAKVLGANDRIAERNRAHFEAHGVAAYNFVSSPGSGKTTLLVATIEALHRTLPDRPLAVIEGDQQTARDAERIRATGAPAIQINTGKGCHLDATMVAAAFERLPLHGATRGHGHAHDHVHEHEIPPVHAHAASEPAALLFIENVGNLVCPALWDLGERAKIAILSVTEGDDKPLKYPDLFAAAKLMVLTKTDLLPHVDFDVPRCIEFARRVNPAIEVLLASAKTGQGLEAWIDWLLADADAAVVAHEATA